MPKRVILTLILALMAASWLALPHFVHAANCFYHSEAMGYVCDTEPVSPQFTALPDVADSLLDHQLYAYLEDYIDVYSAPSTSAPILHNVGRGFFYVTIYSRVKDEQGTLWYEINPGQFVQENGVREVGFSQFQGVMLSQNPERPFGWILAAVTPSQTPGGEPDPLATRLERYTFFEVFDAISVTEADGDWIWYNIGSERWIRQTLVSLVQPIARPAEVGENEFWTAVDLYEQSIAAYEGDRMVFATLVSSGLNRWPTYEGLFQVWDRWDKTNMSGAEGRVDYYIVEDVPHTMYFDRNNEIALHGAYWHDRFGYKHSHGCVNMPPLASEWVYNWSATAPNDLWVSVYTSDPTHYFTLYGN